MMRLTLEEINSLRTILAATEADPSGVVEVTNAALAVACLALLERHALQDTVILWERRYSRLVQWWIHGGRWN